MKRCPACGSISPDREMICGACRSSLANVPFQTMEEIKNKRDDDDRREAVKEHRAFEKIKVRRVATMVTGMFVGAGVILAGVYLLFNQDVYGVFLIMVGFFIVVIILSTGFFLREGSGLWCMGLGDSVGP